MSRQFLLVRVAYTSLKSWAYLSFCGIIGKKGILRDEDSGGGLSEGDKMIDQEKGYRGIILAEIL